MPGEPVSTHDWFLHEHSPPQLEEEALISLEGRIEIPGELESIRHHWKA